MTTTTPDPKQTLILWALLGAGGSSPQGSLGLKISPKDRSALQRLGLVAVERPKGRGYALEVTDRGWDWASRNLDAPLPAGRSATKAGTLVLQAWLARVGAYLDAQNIPLAELIAQVPKENPDHLGDEATTAPLAPHLSHDDIRVLVRRAYLGASGGRLNANVPLSKVRASMRNVDRATLDAALTRMHREDDVTLVRLMNPREIEPEREASLDVGGQAYHVLWISR